MPYTVKLAVLGMDLEFSAADQKELWRQAALFQSLPALCPVDDSPTRFNYRYVDENDFFEVVNSGPLPLKYLLGQYKKGGDLFAKNCWVLWDTERKEEIVLWENGRLTSAGERCRAEAMRRRPSAILPPVTAQAAPESPQNAVAGRQAPSATFAATTPAAVLPAPVQSPTAQAESNPFTDPTAGAKAEERESLIVALFALAKRVYPRGKATGALLDLAGNITGKDVSGLLELSYEELSKLDAIVKLDQTGVNLYGDLDKWSTALGKMVPAGKNFYQLSKLEIDRIHAGLPLK